MRRALPCLVALVFLFQAADWASAEERGAATKEFKARSEFGGSIAFNGVFREDWFDSIWPRSGNPVTTQHEGFLNGIFSLNATIVPAQSVTLYMELRTAADAYGFESHRIGDNNNIPQFREAWVRVEDVFGKWSDGRNFKIQVGLQEFRYELRSLGRDAFFMDPTRSENPFTGVPGFANHPVPLPPGTETGNTFLGGNPWYNKIPDYLKASEAGGFKAEITPHRNAHIDLGAFIMMEGGIGDVDLGTNIFFINFDFEFDLNDKTPGLRSEVTYEDTSVFNIMISGIQGKRTFIGDGGFGIDLLFNWETTDFEVYAEGHYQNGEYSRIKDASGNVDMVPHEAYAAMMGFRLKFKDKSQMHPYFDVSGWFLSGDEGVIAPGEKSQDFISLESVNSTLILESDLGLDIDCNYWAVKFEIGTHFPNKAKCLSLRIFGGFFNLVKAPPLVVAPPPPAGVTEYDKNLGLELDVMLSWEVAEGAELFLGGGLLSGAKFFEERFAGEDMCLMGVGGFNARF